MQKKTMLALAMMAILLGGVAYVMADSSLGSVSVDPEVARVTNIAFPLSATPDSWLTLTFDFEYDSGIAGGDEIYVDFYSAGATPDLNYGGPSTTINEFNHYRAMWLNSPTGWVLSGSGLGPTGVFANGQATPAPPVTDGSDIHFSLDVKIPALADATNPWTVMVHAKYTDANDLLTKHVEDSIQFDLAAWVGINIEQSTFDFGNVQQGMMMMPITVPTQGFLNLSVQSNQEYKLTVRGTTPDDGDSHSFDVSNIYANAINDTATAMSLGLSDADLVNFGTHPLTPIGSTDALMLYLWITIPVGTFVATYTFTLTVSVVAI